ncbi:MAG: hypothetical protein ACYDHW_01245 [Syntrophorhabdaceae bacterium]
MNFSDIEKSLTKTNLAHDLITNHAGNQLLPGFQKRKNQQYIEDYSAKTKFLPTLNSIILGLLYDKENTLNTIKRKGILRYSRYMEGKNFPESIVKAILELNPESFLTHTEIKYFESVLFLSPIHGIFKKLHDNIVAEIKKFSHRPKIAGFAPSIVKTLLAALEGLFLKDYYPSQRESPDSILFYIKEDIAEAISYIIYLKHKVVGLREADSYAMDYDYISSGELNKVLLPACHIKSLQALEIMIDHFSYICIKEKGTIRIVPPSIEFEKSIVLGYIRTDFQRMYASIDDDDFKETVAFEDVCEKFMSLEQHNVFKYKEEHGIARYRIEVKEPVFKFLSESFFKPMELFREEIQYLSGIFKEQFLNYQTLSDVKISEHISLLQFFVLKRLFEFFYHIFKKNTAYIIETETAAIFQSFTPTFTIDKLWKFFDGIIDSDAFGEFLEILTWEPRSGTVFDIQYKPFLKVDETYMIPVCTFIRSNSIRNVFASEHKRGNPNIMDDGKYDPISPVLEKAFNKEGFSTLTRKSHRYKQGGDIDFIAFKDDFMLIAECKKLLHPGTIYEQRTIYDSLTKAGNQLALIREATISPDAHDIFYPIIGDDINKFHRIKYAIITNSRLFWGYSVNTFPIRNVYELVNFVSSGQLITKDGNYWIWDKEHFTLEELEHFLSDDYRLIKGFYDTLLPKELRYTFDNIRILVETFVMNAEKANNMAETMGLRKVLSDAK